MVKAVITIEIASIPENPTFQVQPLTLKNLEQLLLKLIDVKSKLPMVPDGAKPDTHPEATLASKPEYKMVTEVYASNGVIVKYS
jgi:hypothetical protein